MTLIKFFLFSPNLPTILTGSSSRHNDIKSNLNGFVDNRRRPNLILERKANSMSRLLFRFVLLLLLLLLLLFCYDNPDAKQTRYTCIERTNLVEGKQKRNLASNPTLHGDQKKRFVCNIDVSVRTLVRAFRLASHNWLALVGGVHRDRREWRCCGSYSCLFSFKFTQTLLARKRVSCSDFQPPRNSLFSNNVTRKEWVCWVCWYG